MGDLAKIGQCYCGACTIETSSESLTVAYCHCTDCRRWSGSAIPAFAAFHLNALQIAPETAAKTHPSGVIRQNCPECGSPLTATFPYLPDQIYVPLGVLDDVDAYPPQMHCFSSNRANWLHLDDGLPTADDTGRDMLNEASDG